MYLAELIITNFRQFGSEPTQVTFKPGINALVGPNDSGKTAVIDAIRYVLQTRDQDYIRVQPEDFHLSPEGIAAQQISIQAKVAGLSVSEQGAFAEYLTFEDGQLSLYLNWSATRTGDAEASRRWVQTFLTSGRDLNGPTVDANARQLIAAAYLRPLRDAEREMSPGKGSRLAQVLSAFPAIKSGDLFDAANPPRTEEDAKSLGLSGLMSYLKLLVNEHDGITAARGDLNTQYLRELSLTGDNIAAEINFVTGRTDSSRLRSILERLELNLIGNGPDAVAYGLGSHNLLYMACELLLLGKDTEGLPLLLIEEPEAHLHTQRQLRLMQFLEKSSTAAGGRTPVQVIMTTHSPNLASKLKVEQITLLEGKHSYSLEKSLTKLDDSDYAFLERFLDVSKANLFFARGVMLVEGIAEELVLPTIARIIDRDLTEAGVSIVNVGGTGLARFSRIFQRTDDGERMIGVPVASVTDLDIMPDRAPAVLGLVADDGDPKWDNPKRRWRAEKDFPGDEIAAKVSAREAQDDKYRKTFIADAWTFEYALARYGLAVQMYVAAFLAREDDKAKPVDYDRVAREAQLVEAYDEMVLEDSDPEMVAIRIYAIIKEHQVSKAITAQYFADILSNPSQERLRVSDLRSSLPSYLVAAVDHVTQRDLLEAAAV